MRSNRLSLMAFVYQLIAAFLLVTTIASNVLPGEEYEYDELAGPSFDAHALNALASSSKSAEISIGFDRGQGSLNTFQTLSAADSAKHFEIQFREKLVSLQEFRRVLERTLASSHEPHPYGARGPPLL